MRKTCTSARRDDMFVEGSQEHARSCVAMASDGHVCVIARPHVRMSCGCPSLPWKCYICVHDITQTKQRPYMLCEPDIQHLRILIATIGCTVCGLRSPPKFGPSYGPRTQSICQCTQTRFRSVGERARRASVSRKVEGELTQGSEAMHRSVHQNAHAETTPCQ